MNRMKFFTADTHFSHHNILEYCNRPFQNIEDMNEHIIRKWNKKVRPDNIVYHLGDVGFKNLDHILDRLNGRKVLITGSHDKNVAKRYGGHFTKVTPYLEVTDHNQLIVLCHYAFRVWAKSHYNSWHLYGHSHGGLDPFGKSWDVGVDNNNFEPLSFWDIKKIMDSRPDNFNLIEDKWKEKKNDTI